MPEFKTGTLAIGLVFPYSNPVTEDELHVWIESNNFEPIEEGSRQSVTVSPTGMAVGGEEGIAKREDVHLLYNQSANIKGFQNSSFITLKNTSSVDLDSVRSQANSVYSWLGEEIDTINVAEDVRLVELTLTGIMRVGKKPDVSRFFSSDTIQLLESSMGHEAKGTAIQFESRAEPNSSDWYRLTIDGISAGNPNDWRINTVTRYDSLNELESVSVLDAIDGLVSHTIGNNE